MSVTIPLWVVCAILYGAVSLAVISAGVATESSFVNPNYKFVMLSGLFWPLIIVNLVAGKITGTYIIAEMLDKYE